MQVGSPDEVAYQIKWINKDKLTNRSELFNKSYDGEYLKKTNGRKQLKKALISGITGQDGSYLAELLLEKGYEVHGIKRRASIFNTQRIDHIFQDPHVPNPQLKLHYGDLTDTSNLTRLISEIEPDEIYILERSHMLLYLLRHQNIQQMSMRLVHCECLRRFAFWVWRRKLGFIRHHLQNYMGLFKKHRATRDDAILSSLSIRSFENVHLLDNG